MPVQLTLIVKPNLRCDVFRPRPGGQELFRMHDPEPRQIRVRRHANLRAKRTAKVKLVEPSVIGEIVERYRIGEALSDDGERPPDRPRMVAPRVADRGQRCDSLCDRTFERQPIGVSRTASCRR